VWSIINGDEVVGSTLFKFSTAMDSGDYIAQFSVENANHKHVGDIMIEIEKLILNWLYNSLIINPIKFRSDLDIV
jgi:methionyl-tRNA formyltransferase